MLFNRLKYSESGWIGTQVSIFPKAVFDVTPGIREGLLDLFSSLTSWEKHITTSADLSRTTTSSAVKKFM